MIKLQRISPSLAAAPLLTPGRVVELWEWLDAFAARKRLQKPTVCPHGLDPGVMAELPAIIEEAMAWLETHRGVICRPGDYRLEIPHLNTDRLKAQKAHHVVAFRLPIKPAHAVNACWIDDKPSDGWYIKGGFLIHKEFAKVCEGSRLTVELLAGWPGGGIPHLVTLALSQICKHWIKCPADRAAKTLGTHTHNVLQLLPFHQPTHHQRGAVWL